MGRLASLRDLVLLLVVAAFAHTLLVWVDVGSSSLSGLVFTPEFGLLLAVAMCAGPRWSPALVLVQLPALLVGTVTPVEVVVTTAVVTVTDVVVTARFAHHGPVRSAAVTVEFIVLAALLGPLVWAALLHGGTDLRTVLIVALGGGMWVLVVTPGLRMLIFRQRAASSRSVALVGAAGIASLLMGAGIAAVEGIGALANGHVLVAPLIAVAAMVGMVTIAKAMLVTSSVFGLALIATGAASTVVPTVTSIAGWWTLVAVTLVLATVGDGRRDATEALELLFERAAAPAAQVDMRTLRVLRGNAAFSRFLPGAEGTHLWTHVHPEDREMLRLADVADGRLSGWEGQVRFTDGVGAPRTVRLSLVPTSARGPWAGAGIAQLVDLTELTDRTEELQQANATLARLGGRIAHDLTQPLASVAGFAETMATHVEQLEPAVLREMGHRLERAARRAVDMVDDMVTAAHGVDGRTREVHLAEVLDDVLGTLELQLAAESVTVVPDLRTGPVTVDAGALSQVLLNLLANAARHAGVGATVTVSADVRGADLVVGVRDDGSGIPVAALGDVMRDGHRLVQERAGSGRGLADALAMVTTAGGSLEARPSPDGAWFVLVLPVEGALAAVPSTRVLVVEDEPDARLLLRTVVGLDARIDVVGEVDRCVDVVAAAAHTRAELVLLDRWLPDGDALGEAARLRALPGRPRVVVVSGELGNGIPDASVDLAIAKNQVDDELTARLDELMGR